MRYLLILLLSVAGCSHFDQLEASLERSLKRSFSVVPLEPRLVEKAEKWVAAREPNYAGGSCVHASLITAMRYQGKPELAEWWRRTHWGGEFPHTTAQQLREAQVPFAMTLGDDNVGFLQWAVDNGLGCGVAINGGRHMILLVEMTRTRVCLYDNNNVRRLYWLPRKRFLQNWSDAGSWGVTPVLKRVPPPPQRSFS